MKPPYLIIVSHGFVPTSPEEFQSPVIPSRHQAQVVHMPCRVVISAAQRSDPGKTVAETKQHMGGFQTNGNLKILQKWQKINAESSTLKDVERSNFPRLVMFEETEG